nr:unnamed protein product [Spirometra erinaceieuropaei]
MRPKAPLPLGETTNAIYRTQCNSCEVNYIGETGKRLQTPVGEHMRAVRRMDPLSLVAGHCADSGHTFAFQHVETLGRGSDRIVRETIEVWHTETTSINRCVALPAAYQALRVQPGEQMSNREPRLNTNLNMSESMADTHSVASQPGSDVGAVVTTAVPSTSPDDEKTESLRRYQDSQTWTTAKVNEGTNGGRQSLNAGPRCRQSTFRHPPSLPVRHSPCVHVAGDH